MHNGNLAATLAAEIRAAGGVVTEADLASVQPQVRSRSCRCMTVQLAHLALTKLLSKSDVGLGQYSGSGCSVSSAVSCI